MFKVTKQPVNGQKNRTIKTATFDQPQLMEFSAFTAEVYAVIVEPDGSVYLQGRRKGKKRKQLIHFDKGEEPVVRMNPNVEYAIRFLCEQQQEEAIANLGKGLVEFGKKPAPDLATLGFAFLA